MKKLYMKKIYNIIHTDMITMNGGKNNLRGIVILITLIFGAMGFFVSPIAGVYCPFEFGCFFVPMLFQNEQKYHSEKMYSLIPIDRKDLVRSRFIFTIGIYTVMSAIFYVLMLISMKLEWYLNLTEGDDVIAMMTAKMGGFSKLGLFNLIYFASFGLGLILSSSALRNYFRDSRTISAAISFEKLKKPEKKDIFFAVLIFGIIILWGLVVSGVIPMGATIAIILNLFSQLAQTADGFLFGAVFIAMGIFSMIYKYICTLLEYDVKEL